MKFSKFFVFMLIGLLLMPLFSGIAQAKTLESEQDKLTIYFFWGDGCPHCAAEKPYLEEWGEKYGDSMEIKSYETWKDSSNVLLFQEVAEAYGIQARGVPTTFIGEKNWIGFSANMAPEMENYIKSCIENGCEDLAKDIDFSGNDNKNSGNNNNESDGNNSHGFFWIIFFVLVILIGIFISIKKFKKTKVNKTKINNKKEKNEKEN